MAKRILICGVGALGSTCVMFIRNVSADPADERSVLVVAHPGGDHDRVMAPAIQPHRQVMDVLRDSTEVGIVIFGHESDAHGSS